MSQLRGNNRKPNFNCSKASTISTLDPSSGRACRYLPGHRSSLPLRLRPEADVRGSAPRRGPEIEPASSERSGRSEEGQVVLHGR